MQELFCRCPLLKFQPSGGPAVIPLIRVSQQYLADPGCSHGNTHPVSAYVHVSHGSPDDAADATLDQFERYAREPAIASSTCARARQLNSNGPTRPHRRRHHHRGQFSPPTARPTAIASSASMCHGFFNNESWTRTRACRHPPSFDNRRPTRAVGGPAWPALPDCPDVACSSRSRDLARRAHLCPGTGGTGSPTRDTERGLREPDQKYAARLDVYARNIRTGTAMAHRAEQRFALCSTFKTLIADPVGALKATRTPDERVPGLSETTGVPNRWVRRLPTAVARRWTRLCPATRHWRQQRCGSWPDACGSLDGRSPRPMRMIGTPRTASARLANRPSRRVCDTIA